MSAKKKDWETRKEEVYKAQVKDKACTICIYVNKGGKICNECSGYKRNWVENK